MPVHGVCAWGHTSTAAAVAGVSPPTVPAACSPSTALELSGQEAELSL